MDFIPIKMITYIYHLLRAGKTYYYIANENNGIDKVKG